MPRPPKWNSPTESVRLPSHAIAACLELAKALDQPLPQGEEDPRFAEYLKFVSNLKPHLVNITDKRGMQRYLVRCEPPPSFEEWKQLGQIQERLYQRCEEEGVNPLMVFAHLVERVCQGEAV